jgi:hypothetical protein
VIKKQPGKDQEEIKKGSRSDQEGIKKGSKEDNTPHLLTVPSRLPDSQPSIHVGDLDTVAEKKRYLVSNLLSQSLLTGSPSTLDASLDLPSIHLLNNELVTMLSPETPPTRSLKYSLLSYSSIIFLILQSTSTRSTRARPSSSKAA